MFHNRVLPVHILLCSGGQGEIRVKNVCGHVIHHTTQYLCQNVCIKPHVTNRSCTVQVLKKHVSNSIVIAKLESKLPETLSEIIYRQTKYGHLTIVDDQLFMMFLKFDHQIYPHLTSQDVSVHKDNFLAISSKCHGFRLHWHKYQYTRWNQPRCSACSICKIFASVYERVGHKDSVIAQGKTENGPSQAGAPRGSTTCIPFEEIGKCAWRVHTSPNITAIHSTNRAFSINMCICWCC